MDGRAKSLSCRTPKLQGLCASSRPCTKSLLTASMPQKRSLKRRTPSARYLIANSARSSSRNNLPSSVDEHRKCNTKCHRCDLVNMTPSRVGIKRQQASGSRQTQRDSNSNIKSGPITRPPCKCPETAPTTNTGSIWSVKALRPRRAPAET